MMMRSKDEVVERIERVVDRNRILTSPEDIYVYSFEAIFERPKYVGVDVIAKVISKDEIVKLEELAKVEGFIIVRRGDEDVISKGRIKVLLDIAHPPSINAFDERISKRRKEVNDVKRNLMEIMSNTRRSYKNLMSVIQSLLLDKMIFLCRDCDICSGYCTVSSCFNNVETWSAKGRYLLIKGFMKGDVQLSQMLVSIIYSCTLCGLCYNQCVQNPHLQEAVLNARKEVVEVGLAPELMKIMLKNVLMYGNPMGSSINLRMRWMEGLPYLVRGEFDVLYWAGCSTTLRPSVREVAKAAVEVLSEAGVRVATLGRDEGCCGTPLIYGGFLKDTKEIAKMIIRKIEEVGVEKLIVSCSGCYEAFTRFYPEKLDIEMPCKVLHISELMKSLINNGMLKLGELNMKASYHDPCSLGRRCGIYDLPREVLKSIPRFKLVEPIFTKGRSRCCGGGGGFWEFNNKASVSIARSRISEDILPLGVNTIVVTCPMCHMNFSYASKRYGIDVRVYDFVEVLRMSLRDKD